jgi:hypothetical protein
MIDVTYHHHLTYSIKWGCNFQFYIGEIEGLHPAWNRIKLINDAIMNGYDQIVYLDADTLIVNQEEDIFKGITSDKSVAMAQFDNVYWFGTPHYNSGVILINNSWREKNV